VLSDFTNRRALRALQAHGKFSISNPTQATQAMMVRDDELSNFCIHTSQLSMKIAPLAATCRPNILRRRASSLL
jgi:hypothetical protein